MSVTTPDSDIPAADEIPALREEIDHLDAEILRLIKRRSAVSQQIGRARMAAGGPRIVYNREMAVLDRFRDLGSEGRELGMILLRLGRDASAAADPSAPAQVRVRRVDADALRCAGVRDRSAVVRDRAAAVGDDDAARRAGLADGHPGVRRGDVQAVGRGAVRAHRCAVLADDLDGRSAVRADRPRRAERCGRGGPSPASVIAPGVQPASAIVKPATRTTPTSTGMRLPSFIA